MGSGSVSNRSGSATLLYILNGNNSFSIPPSPSPPRPTRRKPNWHNHHRVQGWGAAGGQGGVTHQTILETKMNRVRIFTPCILVRIRPKLDLFTNRLRLVVLDKSTLSLYNDIIFKKSSLCIHSTPNHHCRILITLLDLQLGGRVHDFFLWSCNNKCTVMYTTFAETAISSFIFFSIWFHSKLNNIYTNR